MSTHDLNALALEAAALPARDLRALQQVPARHHVTERGFAIMEWRDWYHQPCSLQISSLATMDCVWLGTGSDRMHLTRDQAGALARALLHFAETGELP